MSTAGGSHTAQQGRTDGSPDLTVRGRTQHSPTSSRHGHLHHADRVIFIYLTLISQENPHTVSHWALFKYHTRNQNTGITVSAHTAIIQSEDSVINVIRMVCCNRSTNPRRRSAWRAKRISTTARKEEEWE